MPTTLRFLNKFFLIVLLGLFIPLSTLATPQGGEVIHGDITITSDNGNAIDTLIKQQSQKGIIHWQSFDIAKTEHTHFAQPNVSAITLNRVLGGSASSILGKLTATGQIFIINPSGILFGPTAYVDVSGLIATTSNISNKNFLSGNYLFKQGLGSDAKIINQGYIKIADSGLVFLTAPTIENAGIIEARLGKVVLGSTPPGSEYVLDFYGDQLLQFVVPADIESNIDTAITQSGRITAHGGTILLTAGTAKSIVDKAINLSGVVEADTISTKGGQIILSGGKKGIVSVTGKITARGEKPGETGGRVKITGEKVGLFGKALIDVSGYAGGGEILIGADYLGDAIASAARFTYVSPYVNIFADAITLGKGGNIIIWSDEATRFYGKAFARGGALGGSGGFIETSSKNWLDVYGASVDLTATNGTTGTWLLDPYSIIIDDFSGTNKKMDTTGTPWFSTGNNAELDINNLLSALDTANITVQTGAGVGGPGNITLQDSLTYPGSSIAGFYPILALIAHNDININAAITGSDLNLVLETTSSSGTIDIANTINVKSLDIKSLGRTRIFANITTSDSQIYGNRFILEADTTLTTTGPSGDIIFADQVYGGYGLTIDAGGDVTFSDTVGIGGSALDYLTIIASGIDINTSQIKTTGPQTYSAPVTLGIDTTLTTTSSTTGDINFDDTITGSGGLTLDAAGNVVFQDIIGGATPLTYLTVDATGNIFINTSAITTSGTQAYNTPVVLQNNTTLTANAGNILFYNTIDGSYGLILDANGNIRLGGAIGSTTPLDYLAATATGGVTIAASQIDTTEQQTYSAPVIVESDTTLTTTNSTVGDITFANTIIGPGGLTIDAAGDLVFNNTIGATTPLSYLTITTGVTPFTLPVSIRTFGNQTYNIPVILGTNSTLTTTSSGDISFVNTVGGPGGLTINANGDVIFGDVVGGATPVNYLDITVTSGGIKINTPQVITVGYQKYLGPVRLLVDTTLTTGPGGYVFFGDTIDSSGFFLDGLTVNTPGETTFGGPVGTIRPLKNITTDAPGTTKIATSDIITSGDQKYYDAVILGANTTLEGANIDFFSTIDSDTTSRTLGLEATGNITFTQPVGSGNALAQLLISSGTTFIVGGAVFTIGPQEYGGPVFLGTDTILVSATNVEFLSTLDSFLVNRNLVIYAAGSTVFGDGVGSDIVGGTLPLLNLITDPLGQTFIFSEQIITEGLQAYGDEVILKPQTTNTITLDAKGGIIFGSTITGPYNLVLKAYDSDILFQGDVGAADHPDPLITGIVPIGALNIVSANNVTAEGIYATAFLQTSGTGITKFNDVLFAGSPGDTVGTGPAFITTNTVIGEINLGYLFLNVNSAHLTGLIGGSPVVIIHNIQIPGKINPGTHFFNLLDLAYYSLIGNFGDALMQAILASLAGNFNFGFGYEFLDMGDSEFDYLLLIDPLECEVIETS